MAAVAKYDSIGLDYANLRRPDPRIAEAISAALGDANTVLNVGAGAGSYEPTGRQVTAIEPSARMIAQRPADAAPAIQGVAESLPFADDSFDAAMAVLTVHHWTDQRGGLLEMRRVSRGPVVILTFDPHFQGAWLNAYFPGLATLDLAQMPSISLYEDVLGPVSVTPLAVPHDCSDGFLYAYWRRPAAYLDPRIRTGMSSFHALGDVSQGVDRLASDLESGAWDAQYSALMDCETYDAGYRLIVTK